MAKGKNLNPADAHRRSLRKKELKKNKVERQKNRDFALVKKDTGEIEDEIEELEKLPEPSAVQKARLSELKSELSRINKKKEEYIEEHPEQRKLVYASARRREQRQKEMVGAQLDSQPVKNQRNLFNKNGLPRHPERSIYFDPRLNPYGMPPPGMPYVERALLPGEVDSDADEVGKNDDDGEPEDDIPMPEGPPPETALKKSIDKSDDESDLDDIPMPVGPPPAARKALSSPPLPPGQPPLPPGPLPIMPPFPQNTSMPLLPGSASLPSPLPMAGIPGILPPFPPQGFPPPPPPFGFAASGLPPPPPGFYPRRAQSASSMQDPLSSVPHQTYQGHRQSKQGPALAQSSLPYNSSLPPRPITSESTPMEQKSQARESAIISAEPQLRDFKKESTTFVPSALKRKRAGGTTGSSTVGKINAAPSLDKDDGNIAGSVVPKPDLLGTLKEKFGPLPNSSLVEEPNLKKRKVETKEKQKDDYDNFLAEMGDILAPSQ